MNNEMHTSYGYLSIVNESNFLEAVKALKDGKCKAILGPVGGILSLNKNGCLVYDCRKNAVDDSDHIYFSVENYLSNKWRWLN